MPNYFIYATRIIFSPFLFLIYYLSGFIPKSKKIWVFGAWNGNLFRGNSKIYFQYVNHSHQSIKAIWLTKNKALLKELRNKGYPCHQTYSLKGIVYSVLAKYNFISHSMSDTGGYFSRKCVTINFSHATCPIKKMGFASNLPQYETTKLFKRIYYFFVSPFLLKKPNFVVSSSPFTAKIVKSIYKISRENILLCGLPKTDFLLSKNLDLDNKINTFLAKFSTDSHYKNIILFLPTYRNYNYEIFDFGFDLDDLTNFLVESDSVLIMNLHPFDQNRFKTLSHLNSKRIFLKNYNGDELNLLLRKVDILITDYSSVWADYLVYNGNNIFAQFDHQEYLKEREIYSYANKLPGHQVKDWPELIEKMKNILIDGDNAFQSERIAMRNKIYNNLDGRACERLFNLIKSMNKD